MLRGFVFCLLLGAVALGAAETRQQFSDASPQWLRAVGKLSVPGYRLADGERQHHQEDCSATLIGPQTILSAWHCLEYYGDLSRDIVFTLPYLPDSPALVANKLADGGGMSDDWVLLRLARPIRGVDPLAVSQHRSAALRDGLLLAGYSGDQGLGDGGEQLTWETGCAVTANEWYRLATACVAFKGASGGPVLMDAAIVGVISSGDGIATTWFTPSTSFIRAVRLHRR